MKALSVALIQHANQGDIARNRAYIAEHVAIAAARVTIRNTRDLRDVLIVQSFAGEALSIAKDVRISRINHG